MASSHSSTTSTTTSSSRSSSSSSSSLSSSSTSSLSSTPVLLSSLSNSSPASSKIPSRVLVKFSHNPDDPDEAMTARRFPEDLPQTVFGYLNGDLKTDGPNKEDKEIKKFTVAERLQFKLFDRKVPDLISTQATEAARLILGGEENEVKKALALVEKHPDLLCCRVTARDRVGSPALCVMTKETESRYDVCLMPEKKEDKENEVEPNKLYVSMDKELGFCYRVAVQTIRGREVIKAPIDANKLVLPPDLSKGITLETLEKYRLQILKLAASRGHVDNKLCIKQARDGSLEYQVLTPEGKYVQGTITQAELNQEIKGELTIHTLNALQGDILEITARRGHTPLGRESKERTLLQHAIISAGDVNLQKEIKHEKDNGLAEQLISLGKLSKEEVDEQLDTARKAQLNNEIKNTPRILAAIKKLGDDICKVNTSGLMDIPDEYSRFIALQTRCQLLIDQFEEELRSDPNHIIDINVLHQATAWFEKRETLKRFDGWWSPQSDVFRVTLGLLQPKLATRDRHVVNNGIGPVANSKVVPPRTSNNVDGSSHFNSSSRLGRDFCLENYGDRRVAWRTEGVGRACGLMLRSETLGILCQSKTAALQNLCNISRRAKHSLTDTFKRT